MTVTRAHLSRNVAKRVRLQCAEQASDPCRLRVRRPNGWSREDFRVFLAEGQRLGRWTWSEPHEHDVAWLVVSDALLAEGAMEVAS